MSASSFKVIFGDEIRRVGMPNPPPSFSEFCSLLRSIFGARYHPEMLVQYEDEDKDRVTVSSQIEFDEALRSMDSLPVKRFFIVAGRRPFFKDAAPPRPLYFYESNQAENQSSSSSSSSSSAQPPKPQCLKACRHPHPFPRMHSQRRQQRSLELLKQAVPACLERLFEGGKILPHHIPEWLAAAVRVNIVDQQPNQEEEIDLDVDIDRLQCLLHRRALAQLEKKEYRDAQNVLQALLLLDPNSPLALYNLACADALAGDVDVACKHLAAAVANGYRNLGHMQKDTDLDALRQMPAYLAIVGQLQGQEKDKQHRIPVKSMPPANNEPKPVEEKKPIEEPKPAEEKKPVQAPSNVGQERFKNEMQLLTDMGFADTEKNLVLLVAEKGDLASVISRLFSS